MASSGTRHEAQLHDHLVSSDLFPAIAAFARVAHHASFTCAAVELGVSPSALSQTVRTLERRLGVRLPDRSTRRVGENMAQDVVTVPLGGRHCIATVAAPRYLEGRTPPRTAEDLKAHCCLNARVGGSVYRWEFPHKGRGFDIETTGPLLTNDGNILLAAVRAGAGITCVFEAQVHDDLAAGRLVHLLKAWWPTSPGFYLYYPIRMHVPRKLRVFIDFMQQRLNG